MNVFLPADVHKRDLHQIHLMAWKRGMKSLYYCRSKSIQRAEDVSTKEPAAAAPDKAAENTTMPLPSVPSEELPMVAQPVSETGETTDYEECLACQ